MVHLKRASMLILDVEIKCLTFIKTTHILMFIHLNLKLIIKNRILMELFSDHGACVF